MSAPDLEDVEDHSNTSNPMDQIFETLYVGGKQAASDRNLLKKHGIRFVLNVTCQIENLFPNDFEYKRIDIQDSAYVNILNHFAEGVDFIKYALDNRDKGGILVHCMQGQSRSVSVVLAFLMKERDMPLSDALLFFKIKRPSAQPNPGFILQLEEY